MDFLNLLLLSVNAVLSQINLILISSDLFISFLCLTNYQNHAPTNPLLK